MRGGKFRWTIAFEIGAQVTVNDKAPGTLRGRKGVVSAKTGDRYAVILEGFKSVCYLWPWWLDEA